MTGKKENEFVSPVKCDDCGETIEQFEGKTVCDKCLAAYIARVYPNGLDCY